MSLGNSLSQKVAAIHLRADEGEKIPNLLSPRVLRMARQAFGPRAIPFFRIYQNLFAHAMGNRYQGSAFKDMREAAKVLFRLINDEASKDAFQASISNLTPFLKRFDKANATDNPNAGKFLIRRIGIMLAPMVKDTLRAANVYVVGKKLGDSRFIKFRKMRPKEEQLERLRVDDPEFYKTLMENRQTVRKIEERIDKTIAQAGMVPERKRLMGRIEQVGVDPVTDEAVVYQKNGEVLPIDDYLAKRKQENEALRRMNRLRKPDFKDLEQLSPADIERLQDDHARKTSQIFIPNIQDLRSMSDEELVTQTVGEVRFIAITDDKAKSKGVTRILPVQDTLGGDTVVVDGRFKGVYADDLINASGRLIEGTAYDYNPKRNERVSLQTRTGSGGVRLHASREPYVSVNGKGELMIMIPRTREYTELRNAVYRLQVESDTVKYVKDTHRSTYTFAPKDFGMIREAIGGMALSKAALEEVEAHFERLIRQEKARTDEVTKFYTAEKIGGFKEGLKFMPNQKEAMAWCEARDWSGLLAPDTGLGKCTAGETLVLTNKGVIRMDSLLKSHMEPDSVHPVEDLRVSVGEESYPVMAFYYAGRKPTIRVTSRYGYSIEGSHKHPLMCRTKTGEGWSRLPEIREGDYMCIERTSGGFATEECSLSVPSLRDMHPNTREYPVPNVMGYELAVLLGFIVGEGCTRTRKQFAISQCSTRNPENHTLIRELLKSQFGWEGDKNSQKDIQVGSVFLVQYLQNLGVSSVLASDKCVPWSVMQSTEDSVRGFLQALIEGEGSVHECGGVEISSASRQLLQETQILLLRFGIISRLAPKNVDGYDHTYWRLTFFGEDARLFQERIGFLSSRKQESLQEALARKGNPNHDVVPFAKDLVEDLRREIHARSSIWRKWGSSFYNTLTHIRKGRRNPTYEFLQFMLGVSKQVGAHETEAHLRVQDVVDRKFFYDPVVSLEQGFREVMDITVDDPSHTFVGNGFVNHNTLTTVGIIQKMYRDGLAGEEGRFLYVCPAALKGNLPKEIKQFSLDAKDLLKRVDIMSYSGFVNRSKKNPRFADDYVAVFFDEAQAVKNPNKTHKAIAQVNNPRKILMTASPMERDPEELFMLAALANNERMYDERGYAIDDFVEKKRKWKRRYAETVGNRVMGIKDDPTIKKEFHQWVKSNLYFKKKTDEPGVTIGGLQRETTVVAMGPEIETMYRNEVKKVKGLMQDMVRKYRDDITKGLDPRIDAFKGGRLAKVFRNLQRISDLPETVIPGARNAKHEQATNIIREKVGEGSRSLLFTDSPEMASATVKRLSLEFPGRHHAVALSDSIQIWANGEMVREFREKAYTDPETGRRIRRSDWKVFVLKHEVSRKLNVLTCTLTKTYSTGQNLQSFTTVIHLDRDTWNSEEMKQRTARSWRTGQKNTVEEYTLDTVYNEPEGDFDSTLDEIRRYMQDMEEGLFDEVVRDSQSQALGVEFADMAQMDASLVALNRRYMEQALSPYATQIEGL